MRVVLMWDSRSEKGKETHLGTVDLDVLPVTGTLISIYNNEKPISERKWIVEHPAMESLITKNGEGHGTYYCYVKPES